MDKLFIIIVDCKQLTNGARLVMKFTKDIPSGKLRSLLGYSLEDKKCKVSPPLTPNLFGVPWSRFSS